MAITRGMKAVTYRSYGSPDVLALEELAKPTPGEHEVLIRVHAATVSSADSAFRKGEPMFARIFTGLTSPKLSVLGTEFSGRIEAVGAGVQRFAAGDEIFAATGASLGAHAQYLCLPETGALARKPTNLTHSEAAAVCEGALTALPFLRDEAKLERGQTILINGAAGSVGTSAVQLAKYFGAHVTAVCSARNLELVRELGADAVIDYTQADFTRAGISYDVIFDAVGKRSFSACKRALKPGGVYLSTVPSLTLVFQMLWTAKFGSKRAKIAFTGLRPAADKAKDLVVLAALIEAGQLKAVIDGRYPIERAAQAHRQVDTGHKRGSVVMTMIDGATD